MGTKGEGTDFARELLDAAADAVACGKDAQRFLNGCEPVLTRFCRSLQQFKMQKFSDEKKILESIPEKGSLVHFLYDCIRNRFMYRNKVGTARKQLSEFSSTWDRSFTSHIKSCHTCKTVDLGDTARGPAPPPKPKRPWCRTPIPFFLELLAFSGIALPILVLIKGSSCTMQHVLIAMGIVFMLPLAIFLFRRWRMGTWPVGSLICGAYAPASRCYPLCCLWRPSYTYMDNAVGADGAAIIVQDEPMQCFSFGRWHRCKVPENGMVISSSSDVSKRWCREGVVRDIYIQKTSPDAQYHAQVEANGKIVGGAAACSFDGSSIRLGESEVFMKQGWWRLDFILKYLIALAVLGFWCEVAALAFPPSLTDCFVGWGGRLPLKAVFLLDASGSMEGSPWDNEKKAVGSIVQAFQGTYSSGADDMLHVGVIQFSSHAKSEVPITNNMNKVLTGVRNIKMKSGGTVFSEPLKLCQSELSAYTGAGNQTFDACVLLTDGENQDEPGQMDNAVSKDTAIFGIYVGDNPRSAAALKDISTCGAADHSPDCHFFASASDFSQLNKRAKEVAESVKKAADKAGGKALDQLPPEWLLMGLWGLLPAFIWWLYLLCPCHNRSGAPKPPRPPRPVREPLRLMAAGRNETGEGREMPVMGS